MVAWSRMVASGWSDEKQLDSDKANRTDGVQSEEKRSKGDPYVMVQMTVWLPVRRVQFIHFKFKMPVRSPRQVVKYTFLGWGEEKNPVNVTKEM